MMAQSGNWSFQTNSIGMDEVSTLYVYRCFVDSVGPSTDAKAHFQGDDPYWEVRFSLKSYERPSC